MRHVMVAEHAQARIADHGLEALRAEIDADDEHAACYQTL
jgi:hypothetical protein